MFVLMDGHGYMTPLVVGGEPVERSKRLGTGRDPSCVGGVPYGYWVRTRTQVIGCRQGKPNDIGGGRAKVVLYFMA